MIVFLSYHTINCHYNELYKSLYKLVHTNYFKDVALASSFMYRISANSFRENYYFFNLALCTVVNFGHST